MATDKVKKVFNAVTGKYYLIRKRSEINPDAGKIRGMWKPKI
jgi:hypothetical protein